MHNRPLYHATSSKPAYLLRYSWTGWPSIGTLPALDVAELLTAVCPSWESDGLRVLEHSWSPGKVQVTFSAKPHVSPVVITSRAKGRLQYAMRQFGKPCRFSRKVSLRSIGNNTRESVEKYIRNQVDRAGFVDPTFIELLRSLHLSDPKVHLAEPTSSARGRYWFNLHLVLVADGRYRSRDIGVYERIRDGCVQIAAEQGYAMSELSIMPDHLHTALRGNIEQSPEEIALTFQNDLSYLAGQGRRWSDGYYVGTFSEYDMGAVRSRQPSAPSSELDGGGWRRRDGR